MAKLSIVAGLLSLVVLLGAGQEYKSLKEAMEATHKGKESLVAKVRDGKGSEEDHKKALAVWEYIATQKPSKGDEASWKTKTSTLVAAAKDLVEKKAGALEKVKAASDCKGCHSVHKGK
jgi:hypothetical protein